MKRSGSARFARGLACAIGVVVLACGKLESSSTPPSGGSTSLGGNTSSGGDASSDGDAGSGGAVVVTGGAPSSGGSSGEASSIPPAARADCVNYPHFLRSYAAEMLTDGGAPSGEPSTEPSGEMPGPCGQCIAKCSRRAVAGCENHTDCVTRHCSCEGCEDHLPGADFCACVETCDRPNDDTCLLPWIDYAVCVSRACAGTCPGM